MHWHPVRIKHSPVAMPPANPTMKNALRAATLALGVAAIAFLLYLPTAHFKWLAAGDDVAVTDNASVYSGLNMANAKWAFTKVRDGNWLPLTWISHMTDSQLWEQKPGPPHLVNAALHAANAALLLLLLYAMTGALWRSTLVAALFALHPLNVEAVAWVAQRKFLLATLFALLALHLHVLYARKPSLLRLAPITLCFALSILSSPVFVTLPLVMLLLDAWPLQRLRKPAAPDENDEIPIPSAPPIKLLLEKLPLFAIAAFSAAITFLAHSRDPMIGLLQAPLPLRIENALVAAVAYLGEAFFPTGLPSYHPFPAALPLWQPVAAAAMLAALTAFALTQRTRRPWLIVGWLWYLLTLLPLLGLVQIGFHGMASRYAYVPLIGIFICASWALARFARHTQWRSRFATGIAVCALAACTALSLLQLRLWKDTRALFTAILDRHGPSNFALNGIAIACIDDDDAHAALRHLQDAKEADIDPVLEATRAQALLSQRDSLAAMRHAEKALSVAPKYARAEYFKGLALLQAGQNDDAVDAFNHALRIRGAYPEALAGIGTAYYQKGVYKESLKIMQDALAQKPYSTDFKNNVAWVLATCPLPSLRNGQRAVMLAREAVAASPDNNVSFLDTLAAAYAESGEFEKATDTIHEALDISRRNGLYNLIGAFEARLQLYEKGMPYQQMLPDQKP